MSELVPVGVTFLFRLDYALLEDFLEPVNLSLLSLSLPFAKFPVGGVSGSLQASMSYLWIVFG